MCILVSTLTITAFLSIQIILGCSDLCRQKLPFSTIHQEQIELAMKLFKIVFNLNMQNMVGTVGKV